MNELENTKKWFECAVPEPTKEQQCIQIGCHIEEFAEMLNRLGWKNHAERMHNLADGYKQCALGYYESLNKVDLVGLLDDLTDQTVTATGVCHMFGMDSTGALEEVNRSNLSKFENGKPVFNEYGKITKGKDYTPPNLEKFI